MARGGKLFHFAVVNAKSICFVTDIKPYPRPIHFERDLGFEVPDYNLLRADTASHPTAWLRFNSL